jgi:hypothetical protein
MFLARACPAPKVAVPWPLPLCSENAAIGTHVAWAILGFNEGKGGAVVS